MDSRYTTLCLLGLTGYQDERRPNALGPVLSRRSHIPTEQRFVGTPSRPHWTRTTRRCLAGRRVLSRMQCSRVVLACESHVSTSAGMPSPTAHGRCPPLPSCSRPPRWPHGPLAKAAMPSTPRGVRAKRPTPGAARRDRAIARRDRATARRDRSIARRDRATARRDRATTTSSCASTPPLEGMLCRGHALS